MTTLARDLALRVNPERSRSFSATAFQEGLARLETEARRIERADSRKPPFRVSIVGTNGKGSTAFALEQCFRSTLPGSPPRTGLFTSPHLLDFAERIRLDGQPALPETLEAAFQEMQASTPPGLLASLTYFELLTLLAFRLFLARRIRVQIFEAGLGGRLDATRIARADIVLLTHVGMDHTALLGHTRQQILREKLGILTERAKILYVSDAALLSRCRRALPPGMDSLEIVAPPAPGQTAAGPSYLDRARGFARFVFEDLRARRAVGPTIPSNVPDTTTFPDDFVFQDPPGRMEVRQNDERTLCFDNAHNAAGAFRVLQDIFAGGTTRQPPPSVGLIFALMPDRKVSSMLRVFRRFPLRAVVQVCRSDFAPADPSVHALHCMADATAQSVAQIRSALRESPLSQCDFILFLGSHRLYDLFDRVSREERAARASPAP